MYPHAVSGAYDLVVIGCGPAGEKGAVQAAYFGHRVLVVEKAPEPGGAAVHTGTLPSKTLRETALYLSGFRARDLYGVSVHLDDAHAAVPKLIQRKDTIARQESARMRANLERHRVELVQGEARFVGTHEIEVATPEGPRRIEGRHFLIATGSIPRSPPDVPIAEPDVYDSDEILALDHLPDHLVVLGAGVIGCEYACMFAALGVRVTLVEARTQFLPFLDFEIGARLEGAMRHLGVEVRKGHRWGRVHRAPSGRLLCDLADGSVLECEKLLFAAGRVGNTAGLGLDAVGLTASDRGAIDVDDATYRTAVPHVYAVGDVIGFPALASVSMEQARVAVCHMFAIDYKKSVGPMMPYGIYTIPEVSCVGETEETCKARKLDYVVGRATYDQNARGLIQGDLEGMTKLIVHRGTRRVIGVHLIGERASELVHVGQAVMHLGGTVDTFIEMVFNYPTLAESYKYAAYSALGALRQ